MGLEDDKSFKRIPCFTFMQTGYCPYHNRCKFIHIDGFGGTTITNIRYKKEVDDTHDLFYYPPKDDKDMKKRDYYLMEKSNLRRLSIFEHLSEGRSINEYDKPVCNKIKKKKLQFDEKDKQTSRMLYSLLNFISSNKKDKKKNNYFPIQKKKIS
jgi:hypothetical protein